MNRILFKLLLIAFLGFVMPKGLHAQEMPLVVIGNEQSVPDELTFNQLKSVLRGEKLRWDDGKRVVIALMKSNTPTGKEICERIYNMSPNELNKYFLALVFQGRLKAPTFFTSERELEAFVAETPGAIGVINEAGDSTSKIINVTGNEQL
ncbi:hypothetical protein [Robiginitalea sp. IMCC43444]|uniref:hypothetical protein n=1 Tax=Robiginitalea sp. IMCC43444 TaxID=3459121 RepID=UPI004042A722